MILLQRPGVSLGGLLTLLAMTGAVLTAPRVCGETAQVDPNTLTPAEKQAGWRLLFDGRTTAGWRGFQQAGFPENVWAVRDGWLQVEKGEGKPRGGDIVTVEKFSNFELTWEWRIAPGGNSGVKYFIDETRTDSKGKRLGPVGCEYQLIDDERHPDTKNGDDRLTGGLYALIAPGRRVVRPAGEINRSRLVVRGTRIEHWLNAEKVVAYETGSADLKAIIAASKYKNVAGFGEKITTPILLQDHGDPVAFRDIKIRQLPAD